MSALTLIERLERIKPGLENSNSAAEDAMVEVLPEVIAALRTMEAALVTAKQDMLDFGDGCGMRCQIECLGIYFEDEIAAIDVALNAAMARVRARGEAA